MKRHIPGLHRESHNSEDILEGVFLVRVDRIFYRWHPQRPFYALRFTILEPGEHQGRSLSGRLYCTSKALWKLRWFLRDFGYDPDVGGQGEMIRFKWVHPHPPCGDTPDHGDATITVLVTNPTGSFTCTYVGAATGKGTCK